MNKKILLLLLYGVFGVIATKVYSAVQPSATIVASNLAPVLKVNGHARTLTLASQTEVSDVQIVIAPELPVGTSLSPLSCSEIGPNLPCVLTISPGSVANFPPGGAPNPSVLTISGKNTNILNIPIAVVTYGSIYQQGYVFAIDDDLSKYPQTKNVGMTVAALGNNHHAVTWWSDTFLTANATDLTNGLRNTKLINEVQKEGNYAAAVCKNYQIDHEGHSPRKTDRCYQDWYLPAICQMSAADVGIGCMGMPLQTNIEDNLFRLNPSIGQFLGYYWTSTEYERDPLKTAWIQFFDANSRTKKFISSKENSPAIRCVRDTTPCR